MTAAILSIVRMNVPLPKPIKHFSVLIIPAGPDLINFANPNEDAPTDVENVSKNGTSRRTGA